MEYHLRVYERFQRTDVVVILSGLLGPHRILCNIDHHIVIKLTKRIHDLPRCAQIL